MEDGKLMVRNHVESSHFTPPEEVAIRLSLQVFGKHERFI